MIEGIGPAHSAVREEFSGISGYRERSGVFGGMDEDCLSSSVSIIHVFGETKGFVIYQIREPI